MIEKKLLIMLCLVGIFTLSTACANNTKTNPPVATPSPSPAPVGVTANIDAQAVYKQNCISCHGANLEGLLAGKTNLQKVGASLTKDQIVNQIRNGGNGMPPFQSTLKNEEINALADWLATKK